MVADMQSTTSVQRSAVQPTLGTREVATSAARILELGVPCHVTIVQAQPLGMRDQTGDDLYALVLTIRVPGRTQCQVQVTGQVSLAAIPLLYSGNTLPAKQMPGGDDRELAIDWTAALAQVADTRG
jgi:hypothetical protein